MKALLLFSKTVKQELDHYNLMLYFVYLLGLVVGCFAYLNPIGFIVDMKIAGLFFYVKELLSLAWAVIIACITTGVTILTTKVVTKWWEDKGVTLYEKFFKKKK